MIPKITKVNASRLLKKATEVHWWWWCISFSFEICCVRPRDDLLPGRQWARGPPSCSPTLRCPWKQSPCSILPLHRPGTGAPGVGLTKSVVVLFSIGEHPKESVYVSDEQTRIKCCSTPVALGAKQRLCEQIRRMREPERDSAPCVNENGMHCAVSLLCWWGQVQNADAYFGQKLL